AADLPCVIVICLAPQPQLELIHAGEHLIVELLEHGWISGEAAGVEPLHLANQFLEVSQRRRLALEVLAQCVQLAHGFLVSALDLLRSRRDGLRLATLRPIASGIAAIPLAIDRTIAARTRAAAWLAAWC